MVTINPIFLWFLIASVSPLSIAFSHPTPTNRNSDFNRIPDTNIDIETNSVSSNEESNNQKSTDIEIITDSALPNGGADFSQNAGTNVEIEVDDTRNNVPEQPPIQYPVLTKEKKKEAVDTVAGAVISALDAAYNEFSEDGPPVQIDVQVPDIPSSNGDAALVTGLLKSAIGNLGKSNPSVLSGPVNSLLLGLVDKVGALSQQDKIYRLKDSDFYVQIPNVFVRFGQFVISLGTQPFLKTDISTPNIIDEVANEII